MKRKTSIGSYIGFAVIAVIFLYNLLADQSKSPNTAVPKTPDTAQQVAAHPRTLQLDQLVAWGTGDAPDITLDENPLRRNYYIVFDGSGSMTETNCASSGTKIGIAKRAVREFIDQIPDTDNVGLFAFSESGVKEHVPLGANNRTALTYEIDHITAGGNTPLGKSLINATETLAHQAQRQRGYGEYNLVIVTDGQATDTAFLQGAVDQIVGKTPVIVHTIGFCIDSHHDLNKPGETLYRSAMNSEELSAGLASVLAEAENFQAGSFEQ